MSDEPAYDPALAARFRAAFGYRGMKQAAIASALGVSPRTVHRLENAQAEIDLEMQRKIIELTDVPAWFIEHGFAPPVHTGEIILRRELSDTRDELEALSRTVADLARQLRAIHDQDRRVEPRGGDQQ